MKSTKFLIIGSLNDKASMNIFEQILLNYTHTKIKKDIYKLKLTGKPNDQNTIFLKKINEEHIFLKQTNFYKKYDQIIFLSRHSTTTNEKLKTLSVHAIGNWGEAIFGGLPYTLVNTDPILIRCLLLNLKNNKPKNLKNFEVKQEATHHGPYLEGVACIFYEIGSSITEWSDKIAGEYMAKTLIETLKTYNKNKIKKENAWTEVVGFGGSHYCTKFNRYTFDKNNKYCFGHVIPSYAIKDVTKNKKILEEAKQKSNSEKIIYNDDL